MESYENPKNRKQKLNLYQQTLLMPSLRTQVRVPGTWNRPTVAIHKYSSATYTVSSNGHFCYQSLPNNILDSSATASDVFYTNDGAYDPAGSVAARPGVFIDTRPYYSLTAGTARLVRLVAQSVSVTSLSTSLNRKGTIYGALLATQSYPGQAFGPQSTGPATIPFIQHSWFKRANVFNGEGISVNYMPSDDDDFQFLPPNVPNSTRHAGGDDLYAIVIICQGLEAISQIRVDVHTHFEVIPTPDASLAGIEQCPPNLRSIPALDIGDIKSYYIDYMIRIVNAYDNGSYNELGLKDKDNLREEKNGKNGKKGDLADHLLSTLKAIPGGNELEIIKKVVPAVKEMVTTIASGRNDPNQKLRGTAPKRGKKPTFNIEEVEANAWHNPALDGDTR